MSFPRNSLGRLFPGRPVRTTLPRDSEVPELPPQASGNPLQHSWSSLLLLNGPLSSLLPRKGGYPRIASTHRIDNRPDLFDLGWSSHYDSHTMRCGPSEALYIYIETRRSYIRSNSQLPNSPCYRQRPPLVTRKSPVPISSRC